MQYLVIIEQGAKVPSPHSSGEPEQLQRRDQQFARATELVSARRRAGTESSRGDGGRGSGSWGHRRCHGPAQELSGRSG